MGNKCCKDYDEIKLVEEVKQPPKVISKIRNPIVSVMCVKCHANIMAIEPCTTETFQYVALSSPPVSP